MNNPVLTDARRAGLEKNFKIMFGVQMLQHVKLINVVITLFYLFRGVSLKEVFYLSAIFSVVTLILEIPSSYLADRWGRKKLILLAIVFVFGSWLIMFASHGFAAMSFSIILYAAAFAFISGTDEAIIYDSSRELGTETHSLARLGGYHSAQRAAKIISPLIGAFIAQDLLNWQFQLLIAIDCFFVFCAFLLATRITEPHHYMDLEKREAGILLDAIKIFRTDWQLVRAILSRTLIFLAGFIVWRMHNKYFVDIGASVMALGVMWSAFNIAGFLGQKHIARWAPHLPLPTRINYLNFGFTVMLGAFVAGAFLGVHPIILMFLFITHEFIDVLRWPLYSELYNKRSFSHNRATTLSLASFLKSALDLPLLLLAAWFIGRGMMELFVFTLFLALVAVIFFRLPKNLVIERQTI